MPDIKIAIPVIVDEEENYKKAVRAQDAKPVIVSSAEDIKVDDYDALLLPGGCDVDPHRYHMKNTDCGPLKPDLDKLQFAWLDAFVKAKKPILGICRGHQLINVYFGGTLIQDVPCCERHKHNMVTDKDEKHDAEVSCESSWLCTLYGKYFRINSAHHQAVGHQAACMKADLYSTGDSGDHLIEAAHHATLPIWTVQWHPERCRPTEDRPDVVDGYEIFKFFIGDLHLYAVNPVDFVSFYIIQVNPRCLQLEVTTYYLNDNDVTVFFQWFAMHQDIAITSLADRDYHQQRILGIFGYPQQFLPDTFDFFIVAFAGTHTELNTEGTIFQILDDSAANTILFDIIAYYVFHNGFSKQMNYCTPQAVVGC